MNVRTQEDASRIAPGTQHTRAPPRRFAPVKPACLNNSSLNTTQTPVVSAPSFNPRRFSPAPPAVGVGGGGRGGSITHPPRLRPLSALPTHTPPLPRRLEPCPPPAAAAAVVTVAGLCAAPGSAPLRLRLVGPDKLRHCKHFYSFLGPCINRRYNPSQS